MREASCCFVGSIDVLGVILAAGVHQAVRSLVSSGPAVWGPGFFCHSGACFGLLRGGEQHSLTTVSCGWLFWGVGGCNSWQHLNWSWIRDLVLERSEGRVMGECFSWALMKMGLNSSSWASLWFCAGVASCSVVTKFSLYCVACLGFFLPSVFSLHHFAYQLKPAWICISPGLFFSPLCHLGFSVLVVMLQAIGLVPVGRGEGVSWCLVRMGSRDGCFCSGTMENWGIFISTEISAGKSVFLLPQQNVISSFLFIFFDGSKYGFTLRK